ncbi:hypothetical protein Tco_1162974 [Tanacetum coccineum]
MGMGVGMGLELRNRDGNVDVDAAECEAKDFLHVEVQDVSAHRIGVNTFREVDDVVVSEPQLDEVDVDDT